MERIASDPASTPRDGSRSLFSRGLSLLLRALRGALTLVGLILVMLVAMAIFFSSRSSSQLEEKYHSLSRSAKDKIVILTLEGAILNGDGFVKRQIDQIRYDEDVKAIVLRVNSPGGSVTGSDYLYHYLSKLVKEREIPLVVSMGGIAASGAYYISMAVGDTKDCIFAEPTTWTGSIGVIIPHYNVAGLMEDYHVEEDSVKSHPLKAIGSPLKRMTEEERAILQGLVDESFLGFKKIVMQGRPAFRKDPAALDKLATGQVYAARQALDAGLIDKVGFVEDAIDRAVELAGLNKESTRVVKYKSPYDFVEAFLGTKVRTREEDLALLLDLATPRAYYLSTWLSPLAASQGP